MKIHNKKRHLIIPVFLPFSGCKNRCIFCNQRILHPEPVELSEESFDKKILKYTKTCRWKREDTEIEVAFYGGSFTGISDESQIELLNYLQKHIKNRTIDSIRFSTRPDIIKSELLRIYKEMGVNTIEIGAQTFNDSVLKLINRGHTAEDTRRCILLLKSSGFRTSIHLMFGLPGSTYEDDKNSIEETIKLSPDYVRIHPTLVLKGTVLERLYKEGSYKPLEITEAIDIVRCALKRFRETGIKVIRVGLHNDENLANPDTVVAGPFNPSLRELAERSMD
jgi:radical SAM enzyme (TIGR01210 family)